MTAYEALRDEYYLAIDRYKQADVIAHAAKVAATKARFEMLDIYRALVRVAPVPIAPPPAGDTKP
jgi:hypothetical protein